MRAWREFIGDWTMTTKQEETISEKIRILVVEDSPTQAHHLARMLSQEAAKAREAASAARSEAARMRNEAEFERDRSQRLQDQLRDLHQQLEVLTQSNSKYQVRAAVEHQMVADVLHLFSYATCTSLFLSAIVGAHQRDAAAPGQSGLSAEQRKGSGSTT